MNKPDPVFSLKTESPDAPHGALGFLKFVLLLFCLGITAYSNVVHFPFVHDDVVFIQTNPMIRSWEDFPELFSRSSVDPQSRTIINPYYRPVLDIIYKIEYSLFGLNPSGYHFFNIFLHILNSILLFRILNELLRREKTALAVALIFLLHPAQTEAVACISGISNLVFGFLVLSAYFGYLKMRREEKGTRYLFLSLWLYGTGLFAKEQAIIFPALILWTDLLFFKEKTKRRQTLIYYAGLLLLTVVYFMFRKFASGQALLPFFTYQHELILRLLQIPQALVTYFKILFFPADLHYYRSLDVLKPFLPGVMLLIGLSIVWFFCVRQLTGEKKQYAIFATGVFLIAIGPVLNIIPIINEYSLILTAEHFLYVPIVGFALALVTLVSWVLDKIFKENAKGTKVLLLIGFCLAAIGLSLKQNQFWRGEVPLFERTVQFEPKFGRGRFLLAKAYYFKGDIESAIRQYLAALTIMEGYAQKAPPGEAQKLYQNFLRDIYFDLAHCFEAKKDFVQSALQYHQALAIDPENPILHNNLGGNYLSLGKTDLACQHFAAASRRDPANLMVQNNLAICAIEQGKPEEAKTILQNILKQHPDFLPAQKNLQRLSVEP